MVDLQDAVNHAAAIGYTTDPHPEHPAGWHITWGDPKKGIDARPIALTGDGTVTDALVAAYLAKYATKGTEITGHSSRRLDDGSIRLYADPNGTHTERLVQAAWDLGEHLECESLRRWAHMLGFGGHFLTKARRYSITFRALRDARVIYRRTETNGPDYANHRFDRQDDVDTETTLIVGRLTYAGTGWHTTGDALLANTAANQARIRQQAGREELAYDQAAHNTGLEAA